MTDTVENGAVGTVEDLAALSAAIGEVWQFGITGISPLLMHNPAGMGGQATGGMARKTIPTPEDEAESGSYRLQDGGLYFPSIGFRSALWTGASGRKIGKMTARNAVAQAVFNVDDKTPIVDPETGEELRNYEILITRVVVQKSGVHRARPMLPKWGAVLSLEIDTEVLGPEEVAQGLNIAGRAVGVGDWRPEKRGPYGRFSAEILGIVQG